MKKTLEWTVPISVENISAFFTALCDVVCAGADIEVNLRECAAIVKRVAKLSPQKLRKVAVRNILISSKIL